MESIDIYFTFNSQWRSVEEWNVPDNDARVIPAIGDTVDVAGQWRLVLQRIIEERGRTITYVVTCTEEERVQGEQIHRRS